MIERIDPSRLLLKTSLLIILIAFVLIPLLGDSIGKVSLYNWAVPGRHRFPFSDYPQQSYNLSLYNLNAMVASHELAGKTSPASEFRVIILGDSSIWGTLLKPEDTLAGKLNALNLTGPESQPVVFYNLGYPTLSLTKDLLLLERALEYSPDLIIWPLTLESFPVDKQLSSPIVENNPAAVARLLERHSLNYRQDPFDLLEPGYFDRTLFGQRRNLADIYRLQLYGVMWAITGIDQYYPSEYEAAARDLSNSDTFHGWSEGEMSDEDLALAVLAAGIQAAGDVPILFVNEPVLISSGANSEIRYNFYYPRWAFDQYREILADYMAESEMAYLDAWDAVPEGEFTNTAIHLTPEGVGVLRDLVTAALSAKYRLE